MEQADSLADRVRLALAGHVVAEAPFMDGSSFWVDDRLVVSIHNDELLVRVPPDDYDSLVIRPGCRPFEFAARPVPSWVLVSSIALSGDHSLAEWLSIGMNGPDTP